MTSNELPPQPTPKDAATSIGSNGQVVYKSPPKILYAVADSKGAPSNPVQFVPQVEVENEPAVNYVPFQYAGSQSCHTYLLCDQPVKIEPVVEKPPPEPKKEVKKVEKKINTTVFDMDLRELFDSVDTNKSGKISARELGNALSNFDKTRFQNSTIGLLIHLFGSRKTRTINFEQFVELWEYLLTYRKLFVQADMNMSGDISFGEFLRILEQIEFHLEIDITLDLFLRYSHKTNGGAGSLKFDCFIEILELLRKLAK